MERRMQLQPHSSSNNSNRVSAMMKFFVHSCMYIYLYTYICVQICTFTISMCGLVYQQPVLCLNTYLYVRKFQRVLQVFLCRGSTHFALVHWPVWCLDTYMYICVYMHMYGSSRMFKFSFVGKHTIRNCEIYACC